MSNVNKKQAMPGDLRSREIVIFTPCMVGSSLLKARAETAGDSTVDDLVWPSAARLTFGRLRSNHRNRGQSLCQMRKSICSGALNNQHNISGKMTKYCASIAGAEGSCPPNLLRVFVRKNPGANDSTLTSPKPNQRQNE